MLIKLRNISTTTIDVPGHGMVLKAGATMWADALTADLQAAIEGGFMEIIDQVGDPSSGELSDGSVTAAKLAAGLLNKFAVVSWGAVAVVNPTTRSVPIQLKNLLSQNLEAAHVVRVTCDDRAVLFVGEAGAPLSGEGSSDLLARTDETGRYDQPKRGGRISGNNSRRPCKCWNIKANREFFIHVRPCFVHARP